MQAILTPDRTLIPSTLARLSDPFARAQFVAPLSEDANPTRFRVDGVSIPATYTGTPSWTQGGYGPQVEGFTASIYLSTSATIADVYPKWQIALARTLTATTNLVLLSAGGSAEALGHNAIYFNQGTAGTVTWAVRDTSGGSTVTVSIGSTGCNDGSWHVVQGISFAANDHRVYFDGRQRATATNALGVCSFNQYGVGVLLRSAVTFPASSTQIAFAAAGHTNRPPDPMAAYIWLTQTMRRDGQMRTRRFFFPPDGVFKPYWATQPSPVIGSGVY